MSSDDTQ